MRKTNKQTKKDPLLDVKKSGFFFIFQKIHNEN